MDRKLERKLDDLRKRIRKMDSALVAFSGGVDSAFLMRICRDELGEKAVAVTSLADNYPRSELAMARRVARIIGAKHLVIQSAKGDEELLRSPRLVRGAHLYSKLKSIAMRMKLENVLVGSHRDDAVERSKSFLAARRAGVCTPLLESDLSKAEIRLIARELGLPNWDVASSSEMKVRKTKGLPGKAALGAARAYLRIAAPEASYGFHGARIIIGIPGGEAAVWLVSRLKTLQTRLRGLGFSEVILKVSGSPSRKVLSMKKSVKGITAKAKGKRG
jgi:hypothetical protein